MIRKIVRFLIAHADAVLIEAVLQAAYKRKEKLFPEWEVIYLALPRNDREKRLEYLEWMLRMESGREEV